MIRLLPQERDSADKGCEVKPVKFNEMNTTLGRPKTMTDEECGPLHIYNDGKISVSCWRAGFTEWIRILFTGKIWLGVHFGQSQPPVFLVAKKPFKKNEEENHD